MKNRLFLSSPDVGAIEEKYLIEAFRSGWIAPLGPDVDAFELEMAAKVGVAHAVALSSGTAALHLALLGHGVRAGDVVVTSTMTFAATSNAIRYVGAEPYFLDAEADTGNMDPDLLERALTQLAHDGVKVAAVVPVDLLGKAANYTRICAIARQFGLPVIADSAESLGASHAGKRAGAWGDTSILSFNGNKIMTTSGGGMLLTNDASFAARTRYLATQARQPVAHYEHTEVGYNYRLSNLLAALGRAQLSRLDEMIGRRKLVRRFYRDLFSDVPGVQIFGGDNDDDDNFWLTSIEVNAATAGWSADDLRRWLDEQNIESRPLWKPMHMQPVYKDAPALLTGVSQRLFETGLTLPSGSVLDSRDLERVAGAIRAFLTMPVPA
ncbi:DegT/DnrJ/EryC1/StrS family aminotransferase [Arthrobacter sp. Soil761]|uniref:DegT/DnrJ/EryC1/StrS family aminotransferase n=1 Tax=Arthrobacter sp. Soil761 TaxID=1736400 RepID=UPI0006F721DA|nr:aminotransferase class I/II-fold pyridoxal phosphate-dependent enzyme [Arthrobacter sp. Soil761]KRE66449.1 pyridoxal-5'-phosphate-dependent protein [Arthrobacter sp. Soil761]